MSIIRTRLALERTLMSWERTAVSLITFGFTLQKAFGYLEQHGAAGARNITVSAQWFGLAMVGVGLMALVLIIVQHCRHAWLLRELDQELPIMSIGLVVAVLFVVVTGWAVIEVLLH